MLPSPSSLLQVRPIIPRRTFSNHPSEANNCDSWYDPPPRRTRDAKRTWPNCTLYSSGILTSVEYRYRRSLPEHEPDQALLAKLCRLPQVHQCQGRGLCSLPPGTNWDRYYLILLKNTRQADSGLVLACLPISLPIWLVSALG